MAKKKKRRAGRGSGAELEQRKRERLEARREAKAAAEAARRRKEQRERLFRRAGLIAALAAVVWFLFLRGGTPSEIDGHTLEKFSTAGANQHVEGQVDYESTPPVSGAHAAQPAACGTYAEQIPNESQVHTLEHGAVGIQYEPDLDPATIAEIEAIVRDFDSHVFSGPYPGMETPITVTAWGAMMRLRQLDEPAVREFIDEFRQGGDAPEANQDCPNTADQSFSPTTTPSPGASPSPDDEGDEEEDEDKGKGKDKGEDGGDDEESPSP